MKPYENSSKQFCFVSVIKNESGDFSGQGNSIDFWNTENEWGSDKQSSRTEAVAKESVSLFWKTTEARVAKPRVQEGFMYRINVQNPGDKSFLRRLRIAELAPFWHCITSTRIMQLPLVNVLLYSKI